MFQLVIKIKGEKNPHTTRAKNGEKIGVTFDSVRLILCDFPQAVYTLLSCFMDWIAQQYDLLYEGKNSSPACFTGSGSPSSDNQVCRITPSNLVDLFTGEVECIFPFYYKGVKYDRCILFEEDGFVYPIFRCPTKNVTTKRK